MHSYSCISFAHVCIIVLLYSSDTLELIVYLQRLRFYDGLVPPSMMFLVDIDDFLHLIIAAHKDPRAIVNMLRDNGNHTLHTTVDRLTAS